MKNKVARIANLFITNCHALLLGASCLIVVVILAYHEMVAFRIPGFTWAFVCLGIVVLELFDIKTGRAIHVKYSPMRQVWVLACLVIPILVLHPWSCSIEINSKLEYIVSITSVLFLAFYQGFLSTRFLIFRKASGWLTALGKIALTLFLSLACICFTLLSVIWKMLFDEHADNERYAILALFAAFLLFSLLATFAWRKLVSQGALSDQRAHLLSQRTVAVLELTLTGISVFLIGDAALASYGKEHIIDSSASLALYTGAIVLLSCLVPLKFASCSNNQLRKPN